LPLIDNEFYFSDTKDFLIILRVDMARWLKIFGKISSQICELSTVGQKYFSKFSEGDVGLYRKC